MRVTAIIASGKYCSQVTTFSNDMTLLNRIRVEKKTVGNQTYLNSIVLYVLQWILWVAIFLLPTDFSVTCYGWHSYQTIGFDLSGLELGSDTSCHYNVSCRLSPQKCYKMAEFLYTNGKLESNWNVGQTGLRIVSVNRLRICGRLLIQFFHTWSLASIPSFAKMQLFRAK